MREEPHSAFHPVEVAGGRTPEGIFLPMIFDILTYNAFINELKQIEWEAHGEMNVVQVPANGGGGGGWRCFGGGENQRLRLIQLGSKTLQAVAAHPGFSHTNPTHSLAPFVLLIPQTDKSHFTANFAPFLLQVQSLSEESSGCSTRRRPTALSPSSPR